MVVSFVNAGLLTLSQSIGVIMGANIGTTVTAWIISALGFKVDIAAFALPLLAFGIPLLFSQKSHRKSIGEFIFGFSFLFMGLSMLQSNAPDLKANPEMLAFVQSYTDMGYISILLFVFIGIALHKGQHFRICFQIRRIGLQHGKSHKEERETENKFTDRLTMTFLREEKRNTEGQ